MAEVRRGYAMLIQGGDPEISGALGDGIMAVRLPMANSLSHAARASSLWEGNSLSQPTADSSLGEGNSLSHAARASSLGEGALTKEQRETVSAEMDRQKIADYLRVAMHREPVDYAALAFDAEMRYGESVYEPGPLKRAAEKMLVGWALICLGFHELFRSVGTEERT